MLAKPIEINWNSDLSIYASELFLRAVEDEYGWLGGFDESGSLRCILPYTVIRKAFIRMARFRVEKIVGAAEAARGLEIPALELPEAGFLGAHHGFAPDDAEQARQVARARMSRTWPHQEVVRRDLPGRPQDLVDPGPPLERRVVPAEIIGVARVDGGLVRRADETPLRVPDCGTCSCGTQPCHSSAGSAPSRTKRPCPFRRSGNRVCQMAIVPSRSA